MNGIYMVFMYFSACGIAADVSQCQRRGFTNQECTKFALVATVSAQGTELGLGCCFRSWFAVLSCALCFV